MTTATSKTFTTNIWNLLVAIVESLVFAVAVWRVPNRISGLTAGAAFIGFGEAVLSMVGGGARNAATGAYQIATSNSGSSGSGGSGNSAGGGSGGNGRAGSSGSNASGQQAAQQMAAKVQTALTQG
jgi:hypothetical protein